MQNRENIDILVSFSLAVQSFSHNLAEKLIKIGGFEQLNLIDWTSFRPNYVDIVEKVDREKCVELSVSI